MIAVFSGLTDLIARSLDRLRIVISVCVEIKKEWVSVVVGCTGEVVVTLSTVSIMCGLGLVIELLLLLRYIAPSRATGSKF